MSLSVVVGAKQLLQLGVSLSDVALVVRATGVVGNWFGVFSNDKKLLESIDEEAGAIMKRRDLLSTTQMAGKWSKIDFVYEGSHHSNQFLQKRAYETAEPLSPFSWLMISIVTALDLCLPSHSVRALLMRVFVAVLDGAQELEESLRVLLPTNIESWRQAGCVRKMSRYVANELGKSYRSCVRIDSDTGIPQLNQAENAEMRRFLIWLLEGKSNDFGTDAAMVFCVAAALSKVGISLRTEGPRRYETEPYVHYRDGVADSLLRGNTQKVTQDPFTNHVGFGTLAEQIAFRRGQPKSMIHAMPAERSTINDMISLWDKGTQASSKMKLNAEAQLPYSKESGIYFDLENHDPEQSTFSSAVLMLSLRGFPARSDTILLAIEELIRGLKSDNVSWLQQHTDLNYLKRTENRMPTHDEQKLGLWLRFQALVFGFYYGLLEPLLSLELVQPDAYFRGVWGYGASTFFAMCVEFGDLILREGRVSRAHVLYMLSTMYGGRQKPFSSMSSGRRILGILGPISVVCTPLVRITDIPGEIASFTLVDLPLLDFLPEADGELFAGTGGGISFDSSPAALTPLKVSGPDKTWSLRAKMGLMFGEGYPGIVIAAKCEGRLVGWFDPLAADTIFLSSAYQRPDLHDNAMEDPDYQFDGFEISDEHWQAGVLPRPINDTIGVFVGLVKSKNCAALRYAAAGFLAGAGEEVAVATDSIQAAYGRVEAQGEGVIIA